jgi:hypothetical protein
MGRDGKRCCKLGADMSVSGETHFLLNVNSSQPSPGLSFTLF